MTAPRHSSTHFDILSNCLQFHLAGNFYYRGIFLPFCLLTPPAICKNTRFGLIDTIIYNQHLHSFERSEILKGTGINKSETGNKV